MSEQDNYSDNNSDDDFFNYSDGDEDSEEQSDEDVSRRNQTIFHSGYSS